MDRYVRAEDVLSRRVLDGVLVLASGATDPMRVSSPGDLVWHLLAEPASVEELATAIADFYEVPSAAVAGDVERVVSSLLSHGAIVRHTSSGVPDS